MSYTVKESKQLRAAVRGIGDRHDVKQLLIDLREYIDERACDFKVDMQTRDDNEALIDLLEYLKRQIGGHIEAIELLQAESKRSW